MADEESAVEDFLQVRYIFSQSIAITKMGPKFES